MKTKHHGQMSESFLTAVFLSLSGGLQDAYTYLFRGKVFANAQTGNIVLLSTNIMDGRWDKVLHYLVPLCAFALGVLAAEKMREHFQAMQRLHWRQLVVLGEVLLLFAVGFLPQSQNLLANAIVSFSCAMQVQAFRKVNGYAFASTMCIGDLRSGVEAFCIWRKSHEPHAKDRMVRYFGIILLFAVGFLPQSQNLLANAIVSFSCAMQVQAFRKVNGYAFASTMCIGDLRSGVEAFCIWRKSHEPHAKDRMVRYFGIILLFAVGFLPQSQNLLANAIVSFSCAMQVQAFRKVNGYAFASTMCIGDLRSGVEALCIWCRTHEPRAMDRMLRYFGIILLFAIGAGIGSRSAALLGGRAIWICCGFLLVSFALMFIREDLEENPVIEKDLTEIRQETREISQALKQELQEEHRELKESTEPRKK